MSSQNKFKKISNKALAYVEENSEKWVDNENINVLRDYLKIIFSLADIDEKKVNLLLNDESMERWAISFTHKTLNKKTNNEIDEFIGDSVLKNTFSNYLLQEYPQYAVGVKEMSYQKDWYAKNDRLRYFTNFTGLYDMYRFDEKKVEKMKETDEKSYYKMWGDITESFFGCLSRLSDELFGLGQGYANVYEFWPSIDFTNPVVYREKDAKTQVKELFDAKGLQRMEPDEVQTNLGDGNTLIRVIEKKTGKEIARATGKNAFKDEVKTEAWIKALDYYKGKGVTKETVAKEREALETRLAPEREKWIKKVKEIIRKLEIKTGETIQYNTESDVDKKGNIIGIFTLVRQKDGEYISTRYVGEKAENKPEAYVNALKKFANSIDIDKL